MEAPVLYPSKVQVQVWYQFADLEGVKGLTGLEGTRTKNLYSSCVRQAAPLLTAQPRVLTVTIERRKRQIQVGKTEAANFSRLRQNNLQNYNF